MNRHRKKHKPFKFQPGQYEGITPQKATEQVGTAQSNPTNYNLPGGQLTFKKGYIQRQIARIAVHY